MTYKKVQPGGWVTRDLCGIKMPMRVTEVTESKIICGPWQFDRFNGAEIDDDLGWPRMENGVLVTGSFLMDEKEIDS